MKQTKLSPSALFLMTFISGLLLLWILPWHLTPYIESTTIQLTGIIILLLSFILNILAYREFKRSLTPHAPFVKPKVLIQKGIFSLSRNPVYLALVFAELGLAFVFDTPWLLLSALVLFIMLDTLIVRGEEEVLKSVFKKDYESYQQKTRRWL